jgi:glucose/mannose-6-phosphate isomerase
MSVPASTLPLLALATAVAEHMTLAADAVRGLPGLPGLPEVQNIVIFGMGAARTAGALVRALTGSVVAVPILVESSYRVPACVGGRSLVFAISGSGDTDEVNHAAATATSRGAHLVVITVGGWLAALAKDCEAPLVRIPPEIQPARASLGFVVAALCAIFEEIGFLSGARGWIEITTTQLRLRRAELLQSDSLAHRLAPILAGRHVLVQGDDAFGAVAAERWKSQFNQNAKQPAWFSEQPNASHNEAVAWDSAIGRAPWPDAVVLLRHAFEDARVGRRIDELAKYLNGKAAVHSVRGAGGCPLAAAMDLMMLGDVTSLFVAERNGVDPTAIPFISDTLKVGLAPPQRLKS